MKLLDVFKLIIILNLSLIIWSCDSETRQSLKNDFERSEVASDVKENTTDLYDDNVERWSYMET